MKKFVITLFLWFPTILLSQDNPINCEVIKMPSVFTPNNDYKNEFQTNTGNHKSASGSVNLLR